MVVVTHAGNMVPSSIFARSPANSVKIISTLLQTESWGSSDMGVLGEKGLKAGFEAEFLDGHRRVASVLKVPRG